MNLMHNQAFRKDIARALASHSFELTEDGRIYVPGTKAFMGGVFSCDVNGLDSVMSPNLLPDAALIDILAVYFKGGTQRTAFYIAPFSGSGTPQAGLTAADFPGDLTEFTDYSETGRQVWTPPTGALSAASIDNSAAAATFSVNTANSTIAGFAMTTAQAKSATTGLIVAATKLAAPKTGLGTSDKVNTQYAFTATDGS